MPRFSHVFTTPEKLTQQYLSSFLKNVEPIFRMQNQKIPGVFFDTEKTKEINILGVLLIYKFLEYSIQRQCFSQPSSSLLKCKGILKEIERYGFKPLIQQFLKDQIPRDYSMDFNETGGVFIAPMTLNRGQSRENTEVSYRAKISDYYHYDPLISFVILQCLGEIASNFAEHAVNDTKSIMVASGNKKYFEIACADTGNGIVSSLGPFIDKRPKENYKIIERALCKGVSSKLNSGHMGYGLWLINQFAEATNGEFCIVSEGGYVHRRLRRVDKGECPSWKGTIVYLRIPLIKRNEINKVLEGLKSQFGKHKIQRV